MHLTTTRLRRGGGIVATATILALAATACASPIDQSRSEQAPGGSERPAWLDYEREPDETAEGFDLEALIAAAREEEPITVYDMSGKIVAVAEAFTAEYGIEATGVKIDERPVMIERMTREAQSGNIIGDVVIIDDLVGLANELLAGGVVRNWVPGDVADTIPEHLHVPLVLYHGGVAWGYNNDVYDVCPISNVWELTEPEWRGKVALVDPLTMPWYFAWFNQLSNNAEEDYAALYEEHFGEALPADSEGAVVEWVTRLAANSPVLNPSDEETSAAIGVPGQANPMIGNLHVAKFRNNEEKGYAMGVCDGLQPWALADRPASIQIATGTTSPNAAKLFVHWMFTEEGFAPQIVDGKVPSTSTIPMVDDSSHIRDFMDQMMSPDLSQLEEDWIALEYWQDLWRSAGR